MALLGLCLGSFVNALVWRLHKRKDWVKARSQCVHCGHGLAAKDLIPVVSWLTLRGRCRYCQKPISIQYPLVELIMPAVFIISYLLWPSDFTEPGQNILFITWLAASVGLLALAIYDLRWMLLPDKLVFPTALIAAGGRLVYIVGFEPDKWPALLNWLGAVAVAAGIFFIIYMISDKYIGGGDITLGLITGTILATPLNSFLMIFFASVLGLIFALPGLITKNKQLTSKIPYGPFLIAATFIVLLFGQSISEWYSSLLTV